jgi:hypothetical protein
MVGNTVNLITQLKAIYNNSTLLRDTLGSGRSGNFCFGQNETLVFNRNMPKINIKFPTKSQGIRTFGNSFTSQKTFTVNVFFYTHVGDKDSVTGYQDYDLVMYYLDLIESATKTNMSLVTEASLIGFGTIDQPIRDKQNDIIVGFLPITFSWVN